MAYESVSGTVWKGQPGGHRKHEWWPGPGVEEGLTPEGALRHRRALRLWSWLHALVRLSATYLYAGGSGLYVSSTK